MNILKRIGAGLLIIIVIPLIVALFVPKHFLFKKTISINAPIDSVWANVNSLSALDNWSPWNDLDPNMKKVMSGVDGTIGAMQSWESDIVGSGSQTISRIEKPQLFETELNFTEPNESNGKAYVKLMPEGASTNATWGMTGTIPYPFNIMNLFMDMEKNMGKDWDNGLSKLKMLSEK